MCVALYIQYLPAGISENDYRDITRVKVRVAFDWASFSYKKALVMK